MNAAPFSSRIGTLGVWWRSWSTQPSTTISATAPKSSAVWTFAARGKRSAFASVAAKTTRNKSWTIRSTRSAAVNVPYCTPLREHDLGRRVAHQVGDGARQLAARRARAGRRRVEVLEPQPRGRERAPGDRVGQPLRQLGGGRPGRVELGQPLGVPAERASRGLAGRRVAGARRGGLEVVEVEETGAERGELPVEHPRGAGGVDQP